MVRGDNKGEVKKADTIGGGGTRQVAVKEDDKKEEKVIIREVVKELTEAELLAKIADKLKVKQLMSNTKLQAFIMQAAFTAIDPNHQINAEALNTLSVNDRRIILAYQRVFTQIGQLKNESGDVVREQLRIAAEELHEQLVTASQFKVKTVKLCKQVKGYGVYDEFETYKFRAGVEQPMIVYVELENFKPVRGQDGKYRVRLTEDIMLYHDSIGARDPVWRTKPIAIQDESRNRRRDFFCIYIARLSPFLAIGKYNLKVSVTDEASLMIGEFTVPIQIVGE